MLFPNLEAEQARRGHTNKFVAVELGLSRSSYEKKKKTGKFSLGEVKKLLLMYGTAHEHKANPQPQYDLYEILTLPATKV